MTKYTCPVYQSGTNRIIDTIEVETENLRDARSIAQMTLIASDHDWHHVSMGEVIEADADLDNGHTWTLYG